jgi:hypothetical protein
LAAEETGRSTELDRQQETLLAERYAPFLVFHPEEEFFPCSPLFELEKSGAGPGIDRDKLLEALGTPETRKESYLRLTLREKADIATVFYRVRRVIGTRGEELVIDYWLYYPWNEYRVRPGLFPVWVDRSHPNDLEHVHVGLKSDAAVPDAPPNSLPKPLSQGTRPISILASAHEGTAPANRYQVSAPNSMENPHVFVELGSHATAPDVDQNGVYTPGPDGDSGYKLLWGTRDEGKLWARYSQSYMDPRIGDSAIFLCTEALNAPGEGGTSRSWEPCFSYRLVHVDELYGQFSRLGLSGPELESAFETRIGWLSRLSGKSNGEAERLVMPPRTEPNSTSLGVENFSGTERGILLGGTSLIADPGVFLGGRYSFLNGYKFLPDLMLGADGVLTVEGRGYLALSTLLAYPLDAITKVFGGAGLVTDSLDFQNRQWDWIAGLEVRIGHLRFSAAGRSKGEIANSGFDFRIFYFF